MTSLVINGEECFNTPFKGELPSIVVTSSADVVGKVVMASIAVAVFVVVPGSF